MEFSLLASIASTASGPNLAWLGDAYVVYAHAIMPRNRAAAIRMVQMENPKTIHLWRRTSLDGKVWGRKQLRDIWVAYPNTAESLWGRTF